jgi:hypothetical protein
LKIFSNLVILHLPAAYEDGTEYSETSAYKIQTPGNYPKESMGNYPKESVQHFFVSFYAGVNLFTDVAVRLAAFLLRIQEVPG